MLTISPSTLTACRRVGSAGSPGKVKMLVDELGFDDAFNYHDGDVRELRWVDRDITVRGVASRVPLPFLLPLRAVQRRNDGPVVVPGRLQGEVLLQGRYPRGPRPMSGQEGDRDHDYDR